MKALTLWQPWASLVAIGAKRIETRSWSTTYRGPLAIHAAKRTPPKALALAGTDPFCTALERAGLDWRQLPSGVIVATCKLTAVYQIRGYGDAPRPPERDFGDYTVGRFMWHLDDIQALVDPLPAQGRQGLWEWQAPADFGKQQQTRMRRESHE